MTKIKGLPEAVESIKHLKKMNKSYIKIEKSIDKKKIPNTTDINSLFDNWGKAVIELQKLNVKLKKYKESMGKLLKETVKMKVKKK